MRFLFPLLFLPWAALQAQDHGSISGNPFVTPEDAAAGQMSFRSQCAACHGLDAAGGAVAPSLTAGNFKNGSTDEALYRVITKGVPGTAMVAFNLNGREVWQIITFLRSMNLAKAAGAATGNASNGARLFASSGCKNCHAINSEGGFTGPSLTTVGSRLSLAELTTSIADPSAVVDADYWSIRAKTKAGKTVTGIRMNEDRDTVQIRDQGKLLSLRKADLASFDVVRTSPMPSFKDKLSASDLQDLVAYLASLRTSIGESK